MTEAKLPKRWTLIPLQEVARFRSGGTPSKANGSYWNGDIPWISAKDLKSFCLRDSIDRITEDGASNGTRLVPAGTILILVRGMTLLKDVPLGVTTRPMAFNQDIRALCVHEGFDPHFVAYSLLSRKAQLMSLVNVAGHGTGRLATELLESVSLRVPIELSEQQKIAAILSTWDRSIELTGKLIAAKQKRKEALMQQLLTGKRRLPGLEKSPWEQCHLGDVAKNSTSRNGTAAKTPQVFSVTNSVGMIPMPEDTIGESIDRYKSVRPYNFAYNPMRINVGSIAMWEGDEDVLVSPDYVVFRCGPELDAEFLNHFRKTHYWHQFVNRSGGGSVRVRIYFNDLAAMKLKLPPLEEQKAM